MLKKYIEHLPLHVSIFTMSFHTVHFSLRIEKFTAKQEIMTGEFDVLTLTI